MVLLGSGSEVRNSAWYVKKDEMVRWHARDKKETDSAFKDLNNLEIEAKNKIIKTSRYYRLK